MRAHACVHADAYMCVCQCMHTCVCLRVCCVCVGGGGGGEQGRQTGLELGQQEMDMVPRVDETDMTSSYQAGPGKNQDYRHHFVFFPPSCFYSLFLFFCYAVFFFFILSSLRHYQFLLPCFRFTLEKLSRTLQQLTGK